MVKRKELVTEVLEEVTNVWLDMQRELAFQKGVEAERLRITKIIDTIHLLWQSNYTKSKDNDIIELGKHIDNIFHTIKKEVLKDE